MVSDVCYGAVSCDRNAGDLAAVKGLRAMHVSECNAKMRSWRHTGSSEKETVLLQF